MFGGVGGTVEHRSAILASRGIAAFSLAYIMGDGTGYSDMEYFEVLTHFGKNSRTLKLVLHTDQRYSKLCRTLESISDMYYF